MEATRKNVTADVTTPQFTVNNIRVSVDADKADMPLLWFLREELKLKGTKFGCGIGECGACTVHINGNAVRSCTVPLSALNDVEVTTIEGLAENEEQLHPVQQAWIEIDVPQCGYCQAGQIMTAVALLEKTPRPTEQQIEEGMTNICRCASYTRIRSAVTKASLAYAEK